MSWACDFLKLSSAQSSGRRRSGTAAVCPSRCAELMTITAWNLNPTGRGLMLRMPARNSPASRSRYESPSLRCPMATSRTRSRGVSSIQRTTGSISGRNRTASGPTWRSAACAGVMPRNNSQLPRPTPNPSAEADWRNRRRPNCRCPSIGASLSSPQPGLGASRPPRPPRRRGAWERMRPLRLILRAQAPAMASPYFFSFAFCRSAASARMASGFSLKRSLQPEQQT